MVRAIALALTQRRGMLVLRGSRHRAAHARPRLTFAAHAVVVAEGAAAAQRRPHMHEQRGDVTAVRCVRQELTRRTRSLRELFWVGGALTLAF